jgi:DNA-directed RNA polymerase alpha subunit/DNA-directed RNA polymerase subunit L
MNPSISNISVDGECYKFTLSGLNVSLANAIRRTILSDIPATVFYTGSAQPSQCIVHANTTRLHNEILKHRLSCIPIHIQELDLLPENYVMELDMQNDTDSVIIVSTEHFRIRNKANDNYLTKEETRKIFPACAKTNMFIDFARLRPKIGDTIPGEKLKITSEFSVHTAKDDSMFNVVSKCSYGNTVDIVKANGVWEEHERKLKSDGSTSEEIMIQKKNFYILDAHRSYAPDSFDFAIQSVGVYDNKEIIRKACVVLQNKLVDLQLKLTEIAQASNLNAIQIKHSETTVENCFDIILENEDYTIGKVLELILYERYYVSESILTYCGFKKFHPHDLDSTIRLAYVSAIDKQQIAQHVLNACVAAIDVFGRVGKMF